MNESDAWISVATLPAEGVVVETKIDARTACGTSSPLKRQGRLWFFPDGSMYVYYTPTHWRPLLAAQSPSTKKEE